MTCFCEHHQTGREGARHRLRACREGYLKLDAFVKAALAGQAAERRLLRRVLAAAGRVPGDHRLGPAVRRRQAPGAGGGPRGREGGAARRSRSASTSSTSTRSTRSSGPRAATPTWRRRPTSSRSWSTTTAAASATPQFIENVGSTVFRDVPEGRAAAVQQPPARLRRRGGPGRAGRRPDCRPTTSPARRSGRWPACRGKCRVLPGIDIGIPTGQHSRKASPDDTYAAVGRRAEGRCRRADALAQVFRDAAGQPRGRRPGRAGSISMSIPRWRYCARYRRMWRGT